MPRATAVLTAILLLATGLAGCLGSEDLSSQGADQPPADLDELTQPIYDTLVREQMTYQGGGDQDTPELWMDIYRPETEGNVTVPTILVMTPYQSLGDALGAAGAASQGEAPPVPPEGSPYDPGLVDFFVPRGYAVAFADVRGNHNSGGCIDQSGPEQWEDGYITVQTLAEQPWSNGKVGMYGVSYDAETQITTALLNPPALKTIVPIASVDSQYEYIYYRGVPYEGQGAGTMGGYLAISAVPGTDPNAATTYHERFTCQPENLEQAMDLSGDWDPYWEDRAYWKLASQSNVSMLRVHGLQDWNVKPNHIDPLTEAWGGSPVRAIYGQWGHATPDRDDWAGQGGILHRWYDHHLMGIDTGIVDELPPVLIEDTEETWTAIDAFPATEHDELRLQLGADGALTPSDAERGEAIVHDYPQEQASTSGADGPFETAGQAATGHRANLTFTTGTFDEATVLTGRPVVRLNASTDAESTHWVAQLYLVEEDGTRTWINRGYQDTRHLDGVDQPKALEPGEPYRLTVTMFPQNDVVPAGAHLELVLTNDDGWVHQDDTFATSTLELGPGAVLELPLMHGDATEIPEDSLVAGGGG